MESCQLDDGCPHQRHRPLHAVESTTTTVSAEEEVLEVHQRFMTEYFDRDESTLTIQERNSRIAAIAVDPLLAANPSTLS